MSSSPRSNIAYGSIDATLMQHRTQAGLELNMNEPLSAPVSMLRSTPEPQDTQMNHGRSDQAASRAGGNQEDNDQQGGIAESLLLNALVPAVATTQCSRVLNKNLDSKGRDENETLMDRSMLFTDTQRTGDSFMQPRAEEEFDGGVSNDNEVDSRAIRGERIPGEVADGTRGIGPENLLAVNHLPVVMLAREAKMCSRAHLQVAEVFVDRVRACFLPPASCFF
ncbi:hypothetical protein CBER1_10926 [Cercospora berteroae]|uniref:Uncharacterized protein n=1 Tax=Cercospora berteroae TaxID=357750 RepID=A0A2S6C9R6_9PEZI|nr:hypothetical protein CBER1_10926 [Cercospora berteroae]